MTLCLHSGASRVERTELVRVAEFTPEPTQTWFPVSHIDVLTTVETTLKESGYSVKAETHALTKDGHRYFGLLDLTSDIADGIGLMVGVRNSTNQTFPMGFVGGQRVFICDNGAFSSELLVSKKHTRFGGERYREHIALAVQNLGSFQAAERLRVEYLRNTQCRPYEAEAVILGAYEKGILTSRTLGEAINQWRHPQFDWGPTDRLFHVFNAISTPLQPTAKSNPARFARVTISLMEMIAGKAGFDSPDLVVLEPLPQTVTDSPEPTA